MFLLPTLTLPTHDPPTRTLWPHTASCGPTCSPTRTPHGTWPPNHNPRGRRGAVQLAATTRRHPTRRPPRCAQPSVSPPSLSPSTPHSLSPSLSHTHTMPLARGHIIDLAGVATPPSPWFGHCHRTGCGWGWGWCGRLTRSEGRRLTRSEGQQLLEN
jgi:hypothetical protein